MGLSGLCRAEALEAQGSKMAFVVCVGLDSPCEPDESTFLPLTGAYGTRSTRGKIENLQKKKKTYTMYNFFIQANSTKIF